MMEKSKPSRTDLLTAYLADNQVWQDFVEAYDEVFGNDLDRAVEGLSQLRNFMQLEQGFSVGSTLLDLDSLRFPDAGVMVRTCGILGFGYPNYDSSLFTEEDYLRILHSLSQYYQQQGTKSFFQFLSFVLNAYYAIEPLWTSDYISFSNKPGGKAIWDGGSWYPTSHVQIVLRSEDTNVNVSRIRKLFDYIAPIHLVLRSLASKLSAEMSSNVVMTGRIYTLQRSK